VLLGLPRLRRGYRKARDGSFGNQHLRCRVEYIHRNVGDLNQDVKVNRPPMPDSGVGAIIVVGGRESLLHGEGWQGSDVVPV
jgi:hypothetical protein